MPSRKVDAARVGRRASLFRNGRNQAVRIPRDFEMRAEEVVIVKDGERLILTPVGKSADLLEILAGWGPIEDRFPNVDENLLPLEDVDL